MRQNSNWSAIVTGLTLGIVNIGDNGVIIKDPITGLGNFAANVKDFVLHDMKKGVWIGKRTIGGFGISSYATEHLNKNILHYAFMIDGQAFHLFGQKGKSSGSGTSIKITELNEDYSGFQWYYKGETKKLIRQIKDLIQKINKVQLQYSIVFSNCIHVAKAFVFYAIGQYTPQQVVQMILPSLPVGLLPLFDAKGLKHVLFEAKHLF